MNSQSFNDHSPGRLEPIDGGLLAFVPSPLPATASFPDRLWPLLAEVKQRLGLLEGVGRSLSNPGLLLRPLQTREALQSTRLEGTYITAKEFLLSDLLGAESKTKDPNVDDWQEVYNCRKALEEGTESELPLSLRLIRNLHATLMTGVRRGDSTPGRFRTAQVAIGDRIRPRFVPPPPQHISDCLDQFEKYMQSPGPFDPLVHCFLCHYQFETIHPFQDGNGRVGRLLLGLMIQRHCGLSKPWVLLSDVLERQREAYCDKMLRVSMHGEWAEWIEFCLEATRMQADQAIQRCERLRTLREKLTASVNACKGDARLHTILDRLFQSPYVAVTEVRDMLGVTYPTAKADCERLVSVGILMPLPTMPQLTYACIEIFNAVYEDIGDAVQ